MNTAKYFLLLFSCCCTSLCIAQDLTIVMPAEETPLEELITQLETKYDLLFTFRQQDVEPLYVIPPKEPRKLSAFLDVTLSGSGLQYEIIDGKFILLSKSTEQLTDETNSEENLIQLCGNVRDSLTGEGLIAANVYLPNGSRGTVTLHDGSFQLDVPESVKFDSFIISYVGYQEQRLSVRGFLQKPCPTVLLNYFEFDEDFLIVTEYLTDGIVLGDNGAYTQLQPNKIGTMPGQVEPDILNTIHFLPGVSSVDGTPSGIGVQGGTPDQNLILWEGIPIYHTAHYFGMLSAFNPYIMDKVAVYTGGFGAEYGGRISGVIKLESEAEGTANTKFGAGTNLMYTFLDGQLKTKDDKLSAVFSLRRSTTELWRSPAFNNITKRVQQGILVQNIDLNRIPPGIRISDDFSFFDANLKVTYQLSEKDEVSIAGLYVQTDFEDLILDDMNMQSQSDTFDLENNGLNITWFRQWRPNFFTKLEVLQTEYRYDYGYSVITEGQLMPDKVGQKTSSIKERQVHLLNQYTTRNNHNIKLGYQLTNSQVAFNINKNNVGDGSGNRDSESILQALYTAFQTNQNRPFGATIGLRASHYQQIDRAYLAPRVRLWYNFDDRLNFYVSAGKYYQYLSQLIQVKGDNSSISTPVWSLNGSKEVPILSAKHLQIGMVFRKNTWLIDIQAYTKKAKGLTSLATDFDEGLSNRFHIGNADIRGLSVLVKKRWNNYKTWLSYSASKVDHHFSTFFDGSFSAAIDQPHRFNWANIWTIGRFECALGWKISSGRPYSNRNNFEVVEAPQNTMGPRESVRAIIEELNSERLPAEHQLDASVRYEFYPARNGKTRGIIGLSLLNIYHQKNIYSREIYIKNQPNAPLTLAYNDKVNMGFTPNFILRFEW